jgi:hypothetical protein
MTLLEQLGWLALLAMPVACIAWTITHEELFREAREWCARRSRKSRTLLRRKLWYALACEYCLSHYIALLAVLGTGFALLLPDWRGTLIAVFAVVWVANLYLSAFARLRLEIKINRTEASLLEEGAVAAETIESRHPRGATIRKLSVPKRDAH